MTAEPDALVAYRRGRLGPLAQPTAFAPASDPASILAAVADALNACERARMPVSLHHDAVITDSGYVMPFGDPRLGNRWAARMKVPSGYVPEEDDRDED